MDSIFIKGARTHNLKNISIEIPRNKIIVITGLSGSGKSSLAFDTLYAEGQRRYVESLSAYARQFLSMMEKPDVDQIEGLSPAISIEQKATSHNPRSTVGTVTEIYDYLRLLYSRIGTPICPDHNEELRAKTVSEICDEISKLKDSSKIMILSPIVRGKKGEHLAVYEDLRKSGYVRVKVNGVVYPIEEFPELDKNKKHDISWKKRETQEVTKKTCIKVVKEPVSLNIVLEALGRKDVQIIELNTSNEETKSFNKVKEFWIKQQRSH